MKHNEISFICLSIWDSQLLTTIHAIREYVLVVKNKKEKLRRIALNVLLLFLLSFFISMEIFCLTFVIFSDDVVVGVWLLIFRDCSIANVCEFGAIGLNGCKCNRNYCIQFSSIRFKSIHLVISLNESQVLKTKKKKNKRWNEITQQQFTTQTSTTIEILKFEHSIERKSGRQLDFGMWSYFVEVLNSKHYLRPTITAFTETYV